MAAGAFDAATVRSRFGRVDVEAFGC
jgi:hypothetical protein